MSENLSHLGEANGTWWLTTILYPGLNPGTDKRRSRKICLNLNHTYTPSNEYYSAIKKNSFESLLMRWMRLEPIIQSEVSQKDKHQYSILMHIYGIWKDANDNPICKTEKETQMYRTDFWTLWEKVRVGWSERIAMKQVYYQGWNRSPAQVGCMRQVLRAGALGRPRGMQWGGKWEEGSGWGTHVNPWLILVNVWQKPLQYCKVISLQLIKINKF